MKRAPTFELLRERRELPVVYPATGARFTISLRDWQGVLWGVRRIPACLTAPRGQGVERYGGDAALLRAAS